MSITALGRALPLGSLFTCGGANVRYHLLRDVFRFVDCAIQRYELWFVKGISWKSFNAEAESRPVD